MNKKTGHIYTGHLHPLSQFTRKVLGAFERMGFELLEGPEIETVENNFDLLNIPRYHPARDMWDTFYIDDDKDITSRDKKLLRTHTSPVQIRVMKIKKPPIRIIIPGRCFRHEATDATHETTFYQLEGLVIDRNIKMTDLIGTLSGFIREVFGGDIKTQVRPSYFPFVEPGIELSILWKDKWIESLGAGMVHPKVLQNMKLNPKTWQGFAFGIGVDRLTMLYFEIKDIRLFYSSDLRFLSQF